MYWLQDLLTPISDARFHFGRKLTTTDISVLHQVINDDDDNNDNNNDDDDDDECFRFHLIKKGWSSPL